MNSARKPSRQSEQSTGYAIVRRAVFRVVVEGDGIAVKGESGTIVGFFTTRTVFAEDSESAFEKAKISILEEWARTQDFGKNNESAPNLRVELVEQIGLWRYLLGGIPNAGFTFYGQD